MAPRRVCWGPCLHGFGCSKSNEVKWEGACCTGPIFCYIPPCGAFSRRFVDLMTSCGTSGTFAAAFDRFAQSRAAHGPTVDRGRGSAVGAGSAGGSDTGVRGGRTVISDARSSHRCGGRHRSQLETQHASFMDRVSGEVAVKLTIAQAGPLARVSSPPDRPGSRPITAPFAAAGTYSTVHHRRQAERGRSVPGDDATGRTSRTGRPRERQGARTAQLDTTKIGVIHNDAVPTLGMTNPNGQVDLRQAWINAETTRRTVTTGSTSPGSATTTPAAASSPTSS